MKRTSTVFLFLLFICVNFFAQQSEGRKYRLITSTNNTSISVLNMIDPYLSPLTYSGLGVGFEHTERQYFKPENRQFSMQSKLGTLVGIAMNPAFSSTMTYIGGTYSWGAFYHYRELSDVQIIAGATTDAQFGFKSNIRNVNNPINIDLATNLNLAAAFRYDFKLRQQQMRLSYEFETPIVGCMFVPMVGASYYELFDLWNLRNTIHFSSLHNKLAFKSALMLEIPLRKSVITVGFGGQSLLYKANNMVFKNNISSLIIGYKFNLYKFKGKNDLAPANFISTER